MTLLKLPQPPESQSKLTLEVSIATVFIQMVPLPEPTACQADPFQRRRDAGKRIQVMEMN